MNFWVYICPLSAGFSSRIANKKLRESKTKAIPWGAFNLTAEPLLDQLLEHSVKSDFPSDIGKLIDWITHNNAEQLFKHEELKDYQARVFYEAL